MQAFVSAYQHTPFVDGKNYEAICDTCNNVPKMYDYDAKTDTLTVYRRWDPGRLMTTEELMEDGGWDRKESANSIKAVREAIKKAFGKIPAPAKPDILYSRCYKDDPIVPPVSKTTTPKAEPPKKPKYGKAKSTAVPKYGKKKPIPVDPDEDTSFDMD
jgi:hypothetical protein